LDHTDCADPQKGIPKRQDREQIRLSTSARSPWGTGGRFIAGDEPVAVSIEVAEVICRAVELLAGDLSVTVAVEATDEWTLSRFRTTSLRDLHLGPLAAQPGISPSHAADQIVDPLHIALGTVTAAKLRRVSGLGVASLRPGTVDIQKPSISRAPRLHVPQRLAKGHVARTGPRISPGMGRGTPVEAVALAAFLQSDLRAAEDRIDRG
jgi:hypothetical protein